MQYAMPFVILNLGGEMLYILEQRLQAQNIAEDKSAKVLQDVTKAMLNYSFITELMKPQKMYSNQSIRQIFDRLANSSIMRLSTTSMDKLYDLMMMGFKYQVLCCMRPEEILQVTHNHMELMERISVNSAVAEYFENTKARLHEITSTLTTYQYSLIRQSLMHFLRNKSVKVSLFLQDGLQTGDAFIVLHPTSLVPIGIDVPGKARFYDEEGTVVKTAIFDNHPNLSATPFTKATLLGRNLYDPELRKQLLQAAALPPDASSAAAGSAASETMTSSSSDPPTDSTDASQTTTEAPIERKTTGSAELNHLAQLISAPTKSSETQFKINLFGHDDDTGDPQFGTIKGNIIIVEQPTREQLVRSNKHIATVMQSLADEQPSASTDTATAGDDLLDLMDSV